MTQRSLFWEGTAVGDSGPYTQVDLMDRFFRALFNTTGDRGILKNWNNDLAVTGNSSPVSVDTGSAFVYGMFYENSEAVTVSVPTPSAGNSRYDRIVLRRTWSAQQVRIARVSGVAAASPAIPSLTQAAGSIWEVPLATALVSDTGTITLTDDRTYCAFSTDWPAAGIDTDQYAEGAVTPAKVPDRTRYETKGAGQLEPDSTNPASWVAGASFDHWEFADAADKAVWAYFMAPTGLVGNLNIYAWNFPTINGAGAGVENCTWEYDIWYGPDGISPTTGNGSVNVDQQARVNTSFYRDQIVAGIAVAEGNVLAVKLNRDGVGDSYNSAMGLLAIEMEWTADA